MEEQNQRTKRSTGRRLAEKIDRSATNDADQLLHLIIGMGKALISMFRPRPRPPSTQQEDPNEQPQTANPTEDR